MTKFNTDLPPIKQVGVTANREPLKVGDEVWFLHPAKGILAGMRGTLESYSSATHCTVLVTGRNRHTNEVPVSFLTNKKPW